MPINIHDKPFDKGTQIKLDLFENYTKEWLPTMIMSHSGDYVYIFDFFAGPGYDVNNVPGSPIRILQQIYNQINNIFSKKTKVCLILNEYDKTKCDALRESVKKFIMSYAELKRAEKIRLLRVTIHNYDFSQLFPSMEKIYQSYPCLLILDQNGIKYIAEKYLNLLYYCKCLDFLYFVSSSYIRRFIGEHAFKSNLQLDADAIKSTPYGRIHQELLNQLRKHIPINSNTKLYSFTIKKGSNIYGIIFGASHPRAFDKFLSTAWTMNRLNGDANFDIENDLTKGGSNLFGEIEKTKIQLFQDELENEVLSGQITTNKEALQFTYDRGHLPKHAMEVLRKLKKSKRVNFSAKSPLITYENVYQLKRIIKYSLI